jgi:hypothetical protein
MIFFDSVDREERDPGGCIREVGVSVVDVAAQLNLVLLSFNYSFAASGFPDRSGRGQSVVRNLPTDSLQSLRIRGDPADHQQQQQQQQQGVEPAEQQQHHAKGFPGVGANVTELDLSYSALGNLSTCEYIESFSFPPSLISLCIAGFTLFVCTLSSSQNT